MNKKLNTFNYISAISFIISSVSLLFIPLLQSDKEIAIAGNLIAAFFWICLLCGIFFQIYLALKCKQLNLHSKTKIQRIPLLISVVSFLVLLILILLKSKNSIMVVGFLFCALLSLQLAAVLKRKGCLK